MRLNRLLRTIGFRLAALYAGLFGASVLLLFALIFFATSQALRGGLQQIILAEVVSLKEEYDEEGLPHVIEEIGLRLSAGRHETTAYLLLDRQGVRLAGNVPERAPIPDWSEFQNMRQADIADGEENSHRDILAYGTVLPDGSYLLVGEDTARIADAEQAIIEAFGVALVVVILLGFGGGLLLSAGFLRRIDEMSRTSQAIVSGNLQDRIPTRGTGDELDRLAIGLNEMLDRLQALVESLRQVSNDIAHDLRTPLSRLRQRLESARARVTTPEAYSEVVDQAIHDVDAILQTFAALLRISQIEAGTRKSSFSTVDLSILFRSIADTYSVVAEDKGQDLSTDMEDGVLVHGDRELLTQMLANLVENAIRHCPAGTRITLKLSAESNGIVGSVSDDGPGIPPNATSKVFQRFFRLERSRTTPGNGLGLALVAAVADMHNIAVELRDNQPGLTVQLRFNPEAVAIPTS